MAFVPGFQHDVFISYAHADDRVWIGAFYERLKSALPRLLPGASVWIDEDALGRSQDFNQEIPASLQSSAVLISLVSPHYIDSPYCVHKECRRFTTLVASRKQEIFSGPNFQTELFGFRCPILPIEDNAYWNDLIPGSSDIPMHNGLRTAKIGAAPFERQWDVLIRNLRALLLGMRHHFTPVVLYPRHPSADLKNAHSILSRELHAQSYRVLPENEIDPVHHVAASRLTVLLLSDAGDEFGYTRRLAEEAIRLRKRLLIWPSPSLANTNHDGLLSYFQNLEYPQKSLLSSVFTPEKLKEEVFAALKSEVSMPAPAAGKPRVYLIYDSRQISEAENADRIASHYADDFQFLRSDDPRQHTGYLTQSDGVLLVWGQADADWCADEFNQLFRLSSPRKSRGLCLFDPQQPKIAWAKQIRALDKTIHITEQFGSFDKTRLEPFFTALLHNQTGGASA